MSSRANSRPLRGPQLPKNGEQVFFDQNSPLAAAELLARAAKDKHQRAQRGAKMGAAATHNLSRLLPWPSR